MLSLWMGVAAMAICPNFHDWMIHHDCDGDDHQCAVTMIVNGGVESVPVDVRAIVAVASVEVTPQIEFQSYNSTIQNLSQGRAPPALSSFPA